MKSRDADILIIPGLGGSGPDHWQSRWEAKLPTARRVDPADRDCASKEAWSARIAEAIRQSTRPVILVAHSLGAIATAHVLAEHRPIEVSGSFLVAPPETGRLAEIPGVDAAFHPYPADALPCPSILVASTDDPYCSMPAAEALATAWGATLLNAGAAGHINAASGHGPWPEGLMAFAGFLSKL